MPDRLGDKARILHILDAITEVEQYTKNVELDSFASNSMMLNATLHQLSIIGEAANRLSEQLINDNSSVPWRSIIQLRNLIVHEYFGIDLNMIWAIVRIDLPSFKANIIHIKDTLI
jgi:uncharacterized protein with HEPN domain